MRYCIKLLPYDQLTWFLPFFVYRVRTDQITTSSTPSNMSTTNDPWTVLVHYNNTEDLAKLIAPSWVGTANIRSTLGILQSCVVVLFACICTALHLDVPTKTAWHAVLLSKLGWVLITLFAPEISVYMAIDQLYQARYLRSDLCAIRDGPGHMDVGLLNSSK